MPSPFLKRHTIAWMLSAGRRSTREPAAALDDVVHAPFAREPSGLALAEGHYLAERARSQPDTQVPDRRSPALEQADSVPACSGWPQPPDPCSGRTAGLNLARSHQPILNATFDSHADPEAQLKGLREIPIGREEGARWNQVPHMWKERLGSRHSRQEQACFTWNRSTQATGSPNPTLHPLASLNSLTCNCRSP
jgi:hypothetical protein